MRRRCARKMKSRVQHAVRETLLYAGENEGKKMSTRNLSMASSKKRCLVWCARIFPSWGPVHKMQISRTVEIGREAGKTVYVLRPRDSQRTLAYYFKEFRGEMRGGGGWGL